MKKPRTSRSRNKQWQDKELRLTPKHSKNKELGSTLMQPKDKITLVNTNVCIRDNTDSHIGLV